MTSTADLNPTHGQGSRGWLGWAMAGGLGLGLGAGLFGFAAPAKAEIPMSYSATGFVLHCPCTDDGTQESNTTNGLLRLTGQNEKFYAAVDFPKDGQKVCSVSLVYHDINGNDAIRARLFKKTFSNGSSPTSTPVLIATATSASGTPNTVRIAKTTSINQPSIAQANAFYYLQVDGPTINLGFLGVQIDVKSTC